MTTLMEITGDRLNASQYGVMYNITYAPESSTIAAWKPTSIGISGLIDAMRKDRLVLNSDSTTRQEAGVEILTYNSSLGKWEFYVPHHPIRRGLNILVYIDANGALSYNYSLKWNILPHVIMGFIASSKAHFIASENQEGRKLLSDSISTMSIEVQHTYDRLGSEPDMWVTFAKTYIDKLLEGDTDSHLIVYLNTLIPTKTLDDLKTSNRKDESLLNDLTSITQNKKPVDQQITKGLEVLTKYLKDEGKSLGVTNRALQYLRELRLANQNLKTYDDTPKDVGNIENISELTKTVQGADDQVQQLLLAVSPSSHSSTSVNGMEEGVEHEGPVVRFCNNIATTVKIQAEATDTFIISNQFNKSQRTLLQDLSKLEESLAPNKNSIKSVKNFITLVNTPVGQEKTMIERALLFINKEKDKSTWSAKDLSDLKEYHETIMKSYAELPDATPSLDDKVNAYTNGGELYKQRLFASGQDPRQPLTCAGHELSDLSEGINAVVTDTNADMSSNISHILKEVDLDDYFKCVDLITNRANNVLRSVDLIHDIAGGSRREESIFAAWPYIVNRINDNQLPAENEMDTNEASVNSHGPYFAKTHLDVTNYAQKLGRMDYKETGRLNLPHVLEKLQPSTVNMILPLNVRTEVLTKWNRAVKTYNELQKTKTDAERSVSDKIDNMKALSTNIKMTVELMYGSFLKICYGTDNGIVNDEEKEAKFFHLCRYKLKTPSLVFERIYGLLHDVPKVGDRVLRNKQFPVLCHKPNSNNDVENDKNDVLSALYAEIIDSEHVKNPEQNIMNLFAKELLDKNIKMVSYMSTRTGPMWKDEMFPTSIFREWTKGYVNQSATIEPTEMACVRIL